MIFSIYPTDTQEVRDTVIDMAFNGTKRLFFTSLHIPESKNLQDYLEYLKKLNTQKGFSFFADISPLTLKQLSITIETIAFLRDFGIVGVRIDFGFSNTEIKQIAKSGLDIAINASIADEDTIKDLKGINLIGWHNYYPRPETGISEKFFKEQNELFEKYDIPLYVFIPGEISFRAPLFMGLPTLENQRLKNAYRNYLEIATKYPNMQIVCAEGIIYQKHLEWINKYEKEKIVIIPLSYIDKNMISFIKDKVLNIRIEETEYSFRIDNTRSKITPLEKIQGESRYCGSLQMDMENFMRYQGEIHIMKKTLPLHPCISRIADIDLAYISIVDFIKGGQKIRFV